MTARKPGVTGQGNWTGREYLNKEPENEMDGDVGVHSEESTTTWRQSNHDDTLKMFARNSKWFQREENHELRMKIGNNRNHKYNEDFCKESREE
jgi:hypothetical protein